jgi:hypothetical protein
MSKMKAVITLFAVFAVLVGVSSYVATNAEAQSSDLTDDEDEMDLEVPILTGTWDVEFEYYEASSFPGVYGSGSLVLVFTEQTRQVFTGYMQEPGGSYLDYINGAVMGHSIRIGGYDFTFTGTIGSNKIIGTYLRIPTASDDDEHETGTIIARKRLE